MLQKKREKTKTKLLHWDSHSQCKFAWVAKQRLYDHGYGTMIDRPTNLWYIR